MLMWSIIFPERYHEYFLPNVNDRTIKEEIPTESSGLTQNITLNMDVWDNVWRLLENEHITLLNSSEASESFGAIILRNGLWITCAVRNSTSDESFRLVVSEITSGYASFHKFRLNKDILSIGKKSDSDDIYFNFQNLVSDNHASITKRDKAHFLIDNNRYGSGTVLTRYKDPKSRLIRLKGTEKKLSFGDTIGIFGLKVVYLGECIAVNKPIESLTINGLDPYESPVVDKSFPPLSDDDIYFRRSPRTVIQLDESPVIIDGPPTPRQVNHRPLLFVIGPALTMMLPMTFGILFMLWGNQAGSGVLSPFMFVGLVTASIAAVLGGLWGVMNYRHIKAIELTAEEQRKNSYMEYIDRMKKILDEKHDFNRTILNQMYPPADICFTYINPGELKLWGRNVNHTDFLAVRLGIGIRPTLNEVQISREKFSLAEDDLAEIPVDIKQKYLFLDDVPICINLLTHRLVGVIASSSKVCAELAHIIAVQLAACHSYNDLHMVFLYRQDQAQEYEFARWLPHVWSSHGDLRMVACNKIGVDEVLYFLSHVLRKRQDDAESQILPHYVVFVTDPALLEDEPLAKTLYDPPENLGLSVVLLYGEIGQIPNNCTVILRKDKEYSGYYSLDGTFNSYENLLFDNVSLPALEKFSRTLSGFRLKEARHAGALPIRLTFLEMHKAMFLKDIHIYRNWKENRTYESMKAMVGYRNADTPLYLDINEKKHGPHGLVAGMTGSGKSELLQTYILSIASNYHPHEVSFVLIDYKGGGMAQSFSKLPHVSKIITNLGGNQTSRALTAIKSEVRRRQEVFSHKGFKHIDEYMKMYREGKIIEPMPHLLIIVDEFAELKKEQGDFVRELVSVARVGRALGIHLILATQKPSASVDDEIQSNSRFRLCLRVQDKQDSMDVIRSPDAAFITTAGRGYFQVGNNELFESFQSGWSGAPYMPVSGKECIEKSVYTINLWGKSLSGQHLNPDQIPDNSLTQLTAMVQYIERVAQQNNIKPLAPIVLPDLPEKITAEKGSIGMVDDPSRQRQFSIVLDLDTTGHILVVGSSAGGKTTFLQTFLYGLIISNTPKTLNAYIIDMGSRSLGVYAKLPNVDVAFDTDHDKINKLMTMLIKELHSRKLIFAENGIGTFNEYKQEKDDLPSILLVLDNYGAFAENYMAYEESLTSLSREGAGLGIYLAFSCANINELRGRIRQNFSFGIGLQLNGRFEYEDALMGTKVGFIPDDNIPGRGLIRYGADVLEFQTALCVDAPVGGINRVLREQFDKISNEWSGMESISIPQVPKDMSVDTLWKNSIIQEKTKSGRFMLLGYDMKVVEPVFIDLGNCFCYTISGGTKTGKTAFLKTLMSQAKKQGADCYFFDNQTSSDELFDFVQNIFMPELTRRNSNKVAFVENGQKDIDGYLDSEIKLCLFIDDMESFCKSVYSNEHGMRGFMEHALTKGEHHMVYIFACMSPSYLSGEWGMIKPLIRKFIERKEGIHLGGAVDKQRPFDFNLPILERSNLLPYGQGHIIENGITKHVIVAHEQVPQANLP